jgi:hypothetical protein
VVISSRHAETAAGPRGVAQSWTAYLAPHPSGRQEGAAPRGDHRRIAPCDKPTAKIDVRLVTETVGPRHGDTSPAEEGENS